MLNVSVGFGHLQVLKYTISNKNVHELNLLCNLLDLTKLTVPVTLD